MFEALNRLFPVWAILLAVIAAFFPALFVSAKPAIQPLLALIMFVMGLTLSKDDFARVLKSPLPIGIGLCLQFTLMPLAAWGISHVLGLSPALTIGMVLVGATSGGTASNVMTWLAGGNVALSVSMTMVSTLLSIGMTPLLVWAYMGESIAVPVVSMLLSIGKLVILPIVAGLVVHHIAARHIRRAEPALATIAMIAIVAIIAIVVALNAGRLLSLGPLVALAVVLHNLTGLLGGYGAARLMKQDERTCRTIAIEVGMQNSGLAVALASQFFSAGAALPGALFSVWHNISGSLLAGYWKRRAVPGGER
ncbi:bile acid:sodium symporter family protein [Larsenimonas rhizosphaerae]|uniref:Bile acid:sodium symporter family protein n=1 Tax=Larsenimonas rhizosphaerae TaxID=2944682 RepID=A0AA41ZI04_9GAMM|nr:bile acid:sodium symporter family protein [Larsenimonas rhizosphaerae]MCM2129873.1 bile acid:sodium symporter family protein [Larsenimonas rhizosphaerae]MCX2524534.1 bile acid:sodium symporter family protein [Larsenimonas rhizosphaerae]